MQKIIIIIVFIFGLCQICGQGFCQPIQYRPYLRSSCTDTLAILGNYSLKKDSLFFSSLNASSTITLPDTGTYTLESPEIVNSLVGIKVRINKVGLNSDTLKASDISEVVFIDAKPPKGMFNGVWLCCGKVCKGYKTEYYNNGNKYFEGSFRKGMPYGKFVYYYETGKTKAFIYYSRKGKTLRQEHF